MGKEDLYLRYYKAQQGGSFPVFRGSKGHQQGAGLGDFLRSIFRTIAPVALKGITSFLGNTSQAHDRGASWKSAAKSSILPALGDTAKAWMNRRTQEQSQPPPQANASPRQEKRSYQPEEEQRLKNQIEQRRQMENLPAIEYKPQTGRGRKRRRIGNNGSRKEAIYKGTKSHQKPSSKHMKKLSRKKKSAAKKHRTVYITPENYNF